MRRREFITLVGSAAVWPLAEQTFVSRTVGVPACFYLNIENTVSASCARKTA